MDSSPEMDFAQSVRVVMEDLPAPIRAFIVDSKVEEVTKTIIEKNHLQEEQGTVVQKEILLMLLGIKNPTELTDTLSQDARLDEATVAAVTGDINELVFGPLHKAIASLNTEEELSAKTAIPNIPTPPPGDFSERILPQSVGPDEHTPQTQPPPIPQTFAVPTGIGNSESGTASVDVPVPPPAMPRVPTEPEHISTPAPVTPPQPETKTPGSPLVKEYSVDPYREVPE